MIFHPALARAVASGKKTQTRRPVRGDKPCRYKVSHDYAVQPGRGKHAIARIKVLSVREERVGQITHADAKAEGFRNAAAFKTYWVHLYDAKWIEAMEREGGEGAVGEIPLLYRFEQHHAHRLVTVITFELAQDTPRFLAQPGPNQGDYTEQRHRAIDDLEVVDEVTVERYAKRAREEGERQRASFKRDLEAERARRAGRSAEGLSNRALRHINGAYDRRRAA